MPPRKNPCCPLYSADNVTRIETPDEYHKAKIVCANCSAWIKFDTGSENRQRLLERQQVIEKIKDRPELSAKQATFLQSIKNTVHLTPAQFTYYENLKLKLTGLP